MADKVSPWSRPDTLVEVPVGASTLAAPEPALQPAVSGLASGSRRAATRADAALTPPIPARAEASASNRAGAVTRTTDGPLPPDPLDYAPADPVQRNRMLLRWFGGAAGLVVVFGVIATLIMVFSGSGGVPTLFDDKAAPPPDTRPDLVKNCPVPSAYPEPQQPAPPPPGPRTVDSESGVSYQAYGAPWEPWPMVWTGGTLKVEYRIGQHFITEQYSGGVYHASILSASIPATNNDALAIDLRCTGRQVAADVRTEYYPNPNRVEPLDEKETLLGGRPAWLTKFRLHFNRPGLRAKSELVGLALINVGKPEAAIVYISIPETHRQFDPVVDEVLDSVRPT